MNPKFTIPAICGSIAIIAVTFFFFSFKSENRNKVGYLNTQKVFADFAGTKEMSNKFTKLQEKQKTLLDSMALEIRTLEVSEKIKPELLNAKKQLYGRLYQEFTETNQQQDQEYTDGLWKQINQYINEYGKENGYSFIYGANGSGNLMYADSTYDITSEVTQYLNQKYAGK